MIHTGTALYFTKSDRAVFTDACILPCDVMDITAFLSLGDPEITAFLFLGDLRSGEMGFLFLGDFQTGGPF